MVFKKQDVEMLHRFDIKHLDLHNFKDQIRRLVRHVMSGLLFETNSSQYFKTELDPVLLYLLNWVKQRYDKDFSDISHQDLDSFREELLGLKQVMQDDVRAALTNDPATDDALEVVLCYPGFKAICHHRIAHVFYKENVSLLPRMISELAHEDTGIDIHPGAQIGSHFFIDHGTGVVIGETSIIGHHVNLYQGVTLGAKRFERDQKGTVIKGKPRHPIIGNDVTIYAGATILGRVTIGDGCTIGGNVWLTESIPAGSRIAQPPFQI